MDQAKQLTKAQYCSVMLVDVEKMELVEMSYQGKTVPRYLLISLNFELKSIGN